MNDVERSTTVIAIAICRQTLTLIKATIDGLDGTLRTLSDALEVSGEPPRNPKEPTH